MGSGVELTSVVTTLPGRLSGAASSLKVYAVLTARTVASTLRYVLQRETAFLPTILTLLLITQKEETLTGRRAHHALKRTRAATDSAALNLMLCAVKTVSPAVLISSSAIVGDVFRDPLAGSSQP